MTQETNTRRTQLQELCAAVRKYSTARDYQKCAAMICKAMGEFPNAPQPHNLFGIVLEKEGDHGGAMKHFRAASALGTVGLSIGLTDPAAGSAALIVEMIGMIMGRLEIFIVLTGIYFGLNRVKSIWREHKKARQQRRSEKSCKAE